jgi:hypothetical protein
MMHSNRLSHTCLTLPLSGRQGFLTEGDLSVVACPLEGLVRLPVLPGEIPQYLL